MNRLENYTSRALNQLMKDNIIPIWFQKLQTNQMAHKKNVSDYLILLPNKNIALECKMTIGKSFAFDRLTQEKDMIMFEEKLEKNIGYVCIMFWKKTLKKSKTFCIPLQDYLNLKNNSKKKSINEKEIPLEYLLNTNTMLKNLNFLGVFLKYV